VLTSKQLLHRTGMSRATLNNYIQLGILPKPVLDKGDGRTRRIGHFPPQVLHTIEDVNTLKKRGYTMAEIVTILRRGGDDLADRPSPSQSFPQEQALPKEHERRRGSDRRRDGHEHGTVSEAVRHVNGGLRLTIDTVTTPAYMVNTRFELEWANDEAKETIPGLGQGLKRDISERNIFALFFRDPLLAEAEGRDEMFVFLLAIAKNRFTRTALLTADAEMEDADIDALGRLYDQAEPAPMGQVLHTQVNLSRRGATERWVDIYASTFREGFFFVHVPATGEDSALMQLLARRDIVIRDLMKRRRPYLTQVAVVVADLQDSVKICAELPPEEYFELINDVWGAMEPKLRKFYATHGKHVGDGMVYYFFPQPDSNYAMNALLCAEEMRVAMQGISGRWQKRKNWINELKLNIGLHEGQEWFGTYQTPTHVEVTVLGDTINMAARLSDFARGGSIWISKSMFGQLSSKERARVHYGIRRLGADGTEILVGETYSRISNLVDLDNPKHEKFRDIAAMPVTEIFTVDGAEEA